MPWMLEHRPQALEGFDQNLPEFARDQEDAGCAVSARRARVSARRAWRRDRATKRSRACRASDRAGARSCANARESRSWRDARNKPRSGDSRVGAGRRARSSRAVRAVGRAPRTPRCRPRISASSCAASIAFSAAAISRWRPTTAISARDAFTARVNFDLASAPGIETFRAAMIELGELVASLGGSLSGEHGDGLARSELAADDVPARN